MERVPQAKSKISLLETSPPYPGVAQLFTNKACEALTPHFLGREACPPSWRETPLPNLNCPLISAGPESPACGKFSAAPHPTPLHSCVRMSCGRSLLNPLGSLATPPVIV